MSTAEAAAKLKVHPATFRKWAKEAKIKPMGTLPTGKRGRPVFNWSHKDVASLEG